MQNRNGNVGHKDRYEQYWHNKKNKLTGTPGFSHVFTCDHFLAVWSVLHCLDEKNDKLNKKDKNYKTRLVIEHIIDKFHHYYVPDCELSLDEGMVPTKNALSIKQYLKDKPVKWGLKTFILCENKTGYIVNAEVYTGKSKDDPTFIPELGVTGSLVNRMIQPYHGQNYTVYTDRFYTSVTLAEHPIDNHNTRLCGTALSSRKRFPKQRR